MCCSVLTIKGQKEAEKGSWYGRHTDFKNMKEFLKAWRMQFQTGNVIYSCCCTTSVLQSKKALKVLVPLCNGMKATVFLLFHLFTASILLFIFSLVFFFFLGGALSKWKHFAKSIRSKLLKIGALKGLGLQSLLFSHCRWHGRWNGNEWTGNSTSCKLAYCFPCFIQ